MDFQFGNWNTKGKNGLAWIEKDSGLKKNLIEMESTEKNWLGSIQKGCLEMKE